MEHIRGEGLVLRLPTPLDRVRWLELFEDPDQLQFGIPVVIPIPSTLEDLDERITAAQNHFDAGEPTTFVVSADDDPDLFLGTTGWSFFIPPPIQVADVGYAVHPDARGRGVATRALRTLTRWLISDEDGPHLARVQLDHSVENAASCRTALAAGFEREGVRRAFLPMRDGDSPDGVRRHDVCLHGFLPHQPIAAQ